MRKDTIEVLGKNNARARNLPGEPGATMECAAFVSVLVAREALAVFGRVI